MFTRTVEIWWKNLRWQALFQRCRHQQRQPGHGCRQPTWGRSTCSGEGYGASSPPAKIFHLFIKPFEMISDIYNIINENWPVSFESKNYYVGCTSREPLEKNIWKELLSRMPGLDSVTIIALTFRTGGPRFDSLRQPFFVIIHLHLYAGIMSMEIQ